MPKKDRTVNALVIGRRKENGKMYQVYAVKPKDKSDALKALRSKYKSVKSKGLNIWNKEVIWARDRK